MAAEIRCEPDIQVQTLLDDVVAYKPIGIICTPFTEPEGMPIQPSAALGIKGTVELNPEYAAVLSDIEGFSHIILLYHCHFSSGYSLNVLPFLEDTEHGLFATRALKRPNPPSTSFVRLKRAEGAKLEVKDIDIVAGTSLLDIKPYVSAFDTRENTRSGWVTAKTHKIRTMRADDRFK